MIQKPALQKFAQDLLKKAALQLEAAVKENITAGGIPFIPLKPATIKRKGSSKPLIDTGAMRRGVRAEDVNGKNWAVNLYEPYTLVHEFGSPSRKIPKRPFIWPAIDKYVNEWRASGVKVSLVSQRA